MDWQQGARDEAYIFSDTDLNVNFVEFLSVSDASCDKGDRHAKGTQRQTRIPSSYFKYSFLAQQEMVYIPI